MNKIVTSSLLVLSLVFFNSCKEGNASEKVKKENIIIDTLYIKWKNNFFYTLKMKSPKTDLDNDPIFVQINKITENSYDFTAKIGFSEFKQKGTFYKIK
mgnify:CR=1 FL=1